MTVHAFHLTAKPTGAACNLACEYCFFLDKAELYQGSRFRMSEEVLEAYVRQYLQAQAVPEVVFSWQGGEPTLMGLDFFRRAVELQRRYRSPGQRVLNSLQTNGLLLDDAWGTFLHDNGFLVGLSLDGPAALHDRFRRDKGGHASFDKVMRAARVLTQHAVEFNTLTTVNAANQSRPLEVYRFLRDEVGARHMQFIPVVEWESDGQASARSVEPRQWGRFLIAVFDEWRRKDLGRVTVQTFEAALAAWIGAPPPLCAFAETCGRALVLEHNGDVYSCDHFVDPAHRLGNVLETPLAALVESPAQADFGRDKQRLAPRCAACEVRFACRGECPKNRVGGLNHLCQGYRAFFRHADAPLRRLTAREAAPPAERPRKVGANAPCPCGSGAKFKRCHGNR